MKGDFRVGLLSTIDQPLLPFFLASILRENIKNIVVFCDSKKISNKDKKIWIDRTGNAFEQVNNVDENIYKMANTKIPFYFVNDHNDEKTVELVNTLALDVLLNAGTPRKIKKHLLKSVPHGIVNVHPGLLPHYRGCSVVEWAIFNNDKIGNTAHFMTEGYDEGNIIESESYEFPSNTNYESIRVRVHRNGVVLAGKVLRHIFETKIMPSDGIPQDAKFAKYWDPIPDEKFAKVIKLVKDGNYKYQRL